MVVILQKMQNHRHKGYTEHNLQGYITSKFQATILYTIKHRNNPKPQL